MARRRRERPTLQRGQPEQRHGACQGADVGGVAGALRAREMGAPRLGAGQQPVMGGLGSHAREGLV